MTNVSEWYEHGLNRGWNHQNFIEAYGSEHNTGIDYPSILEVDSSYGFAGRGASERAESRREFARGWKDGRALYRQGRYVDGTEIEGA